MKLQEKFSLTTTKDEKESSAEIKGVIKKEDIEAVRESVAQRLGKNSKVDGFREGAVPIDIVERTVGSLEIWKQSAQEVITLHFAEILAEEKLTPLGEPRLQFTSIPDRGDVSFSMKFFILPSVELPEYHSLIKDIGSPQEEVEVTDEDVENVFTDIRKNLYKKAHPEKEIPTNEDELPKLTDAYIQEISHQHKDLESFSKGVRESIAKEKKLQVRTEFRKKILDKIIEHTPIQIPQIIIEEESKRAYEEFKVQAKHFNTTVEAYLEAQKMTEEQLWEQLRDEAKKRSEVQLIMNAISTKENILPDQKEVETEVDRFKQKGGNMDEAQLRMYIETLLTNEAVMQSLEKQTTKE